MVQRRLNPYTVAPDGVAALVGVENYLKKSGLDHKLVLLVQTPASRIDGCACCCTCIPKTRASSVKPRCGFVCSTPGAKSNLYSERERAALAWTEALTNIAATHAPDAVYDQARKQFFGKGDGGSVDSHRHDQCLEPAVDRDARGSSGRSRQGGVTRRRNEAA